MTKKLLLVLVLSSLGLAGCVAVPYDGGYAYGPAPAVVAPSVSFGYYGGYYRGGHRHHGHRHRY
jgi:hypothetical protein